MHRLRMVPFEHLERRHDERPVGRPGGDHLGQQHHHEGRRREGAVLPREPRVNQLPQQVYPETSSSHPACTGGMPATARAAQ